MTQNWKTYLLDKIEGHHPFARNDDRNFIVADLEKRFGAESRQMLVALRERVLRMHTSHHFPRVGIFLKAFDELNKGWGKGRKSIITVSISETPKEFKAWQEFNALAVQEGVLKKFWLDEMDMSNGFPVPSLMPPDLPCLSKAPTQKELKEQGLLLSLYQNWRNTQKKRAA